MYGGYGTGVAVPVAEVREYRDGTLILDLVDAEDELSTTGHRDVLQALDAVYLDDTEELFDLLAATKSTERELPGQMPHPHSVEHQGGDDPHPRSTL